MASLSISLVPARMTLICARHLSTFSCDIAYSLSPAALRASSFSAEADAGERRDLLTTSERDRLKALEREVRELRKANEILRSASVFFAKELDPPRPK